MLNLGTSEFVLAVPRVSEQELQYLSTTLFDSWESFVDDHVAIPDYSLLLQVEEGSIRGFATIGAFLGAVYIGIGNYGDFVSGLKTINEQVNATGEYLSEQATRVFSCPDSRMIAKKRSGTLAALQRLFTKVQSGELTPEEATLRAETILGSDADTEPRFVAELAQAFRTCPRFHKQQPLPFSWEETSDVSLTRPPKSPRPSKPASADLGPPTNLRVEVWRESKSKRKQTRLIKL